MRNQPADPLLIFKRSANRWRDRVEKLRQIIRDLMLIGGELGGRGGGSDGSIERIRI